MNKRIKKKKRLAKITAEECWDLNVTLAKYILPRLQKYKEINQYGYPIGLESLEEWHEIIDKMIYAFDLVVNDNCNSLKSENCIEVITKQKELQEEGLRLFAEYFNSLWD